MITDTLRRIGIWTQGHWRELRTKQREARDSLPRVESWADRTREWLLDHKSDLWRAFWAMGLVVSVVTLVGLNVFQDPTEEYRTLRFTTATGEPLADVLATYPSAIYPRDVMTISLKYIPDKASIPADLDVDLEVTVQEPSGVTQQLGSPTKTWRLHRDAQQDTVSIKFQVGNPPYNLKRLALSLDGSIGPSIRPPPEQIQIEIRRFWPKIALPVSMLVSLLLSTIGPDILRWVMKRTIRKAP